MHICAIVHTFQYIVQCILLLYYELVQMMAHTYEKQGLMTRYSNKFAKNHHISFIFRLRNQASGYFVLFLVYLTYLKCSAQRCVTSLRITHTAQIVIHEID